MRSWIEHQREIASFAKTQLFFIGGAPRSGTTWLQQMLDSHPDICCRGEGLFLKHLAEPVQALMAQRRQVIEAKNANLFRHTGGYMVPSRDDIELLIGTAILQALRQQCAGVDYQAVGEKTPENVFFFPRLKRLFPNAKFIGIARDPRDVLTSAWHYFNKPQAGENEIEAKTAFVRGALGALGQGARNMMALAEQHPTDCMIVTYEALRLSPEPIVAKLFRFLSVSDRNEIVSDCLARTAFSVMSEGRGSGIEKEGSFFRKGVVGDWKTTLTLEMSQMILSELGWMFPHFGWTI
jgi:hypothetical protein